VRDPAEDRSGGEATFRLRNPWRQPPGPDIGDVGDPLVDAGLVAIADELDHGAAELILGEEEEGA